MQHPIPFTESKCAIHSTYTTWFIQSTTHAPSKDTCKIFMFLQSHIIHQLLPRSHLIVFPFPFPSITYPHSTFSTTIFNISSMPFPAFFGSFATACQYSPWRGSLSIHFCITSARFSYQVMLVLIYISNATTPPRPPILIFTSGTREDETYFSTMLQ